MNARSEIQKFSDAQSIPNKLLRSVIVLMAVHWLGLLTFAFWLMSTWSHEAAYRWLAPAALVLAYTHFQFCLHLRLNHPPQNGRLYPSVGMANQMTLARGWGISLIAGFILLPYVEPASSDSRAEWLPGIIYLMAAGTDFLDGLWARITRSSSVLGQKLDIEMDALGLLTTSVLLVVWGRLPTVYLLVGASYYLFRIGTHIRRRRGRTVCALIERPFARVMAGIQMVFVGLALLPIFAVPLLRIAAVYFMLPLLAGFVWDWLIIQERPAAKTKENIERVVGIVAAVLPVIMRSVVFLSSWSVAGALRGSGPDVIGGIWLFLSVMMVLGFLGRSAAIVAACLVAHTAVSISTPLLMVAFSACIVLIVTGTGAWSWWKPEDAFLSRRIGGSTTRSVHAQAG